MLDITLIPALQEQLSQPLPGISAQMEMAVGSRRAFPSIPANAKKAAVLCLLYPKNAAWHIVLMQRVSTNPKDRHSGQMSFPGGKLESTDASYEQAALRETEEEVGIPQTAISLLGKMTPLYIPVSNFHVHPFVGVLEDTPTFQPEWQEVKEVVEMPLSLLLNDTTRQLTDISIRGHTIKEVPYFNIFGKIVWGATAMMLSEFVEVVREAMITVSEGN